MDEDKFTTLKMIKLWKEKHPHLSIKEVCSQTFSLARKKHQNLGFPLTTQSRFYNYVLKYSSRINFDLSVD